MSYAGAINLAGGGGGGSAILSITGNDEVPIFPTANNINIVGGSSTINNANGITTAKSSASTETIFLTNRITGSATSIGLSTTTIITFPLSTTPGTYTFDCSIAGFATAGAGLPLGAGYTIVGSIRSNGTTATLLPSQAVDSFEDAALASNTSSLAVSGNNALIQVTGVTGFTIDWNATGNYVFVG